MAALVAPRPLTFINVLDAEAKPMSPADVEEAYDKARRVYAWKQSADRFRLVRRY